MVDPSRRVGAGRTTDLCFPTPLSTPGVRLSPHPAFQGVTFRAWGQPKFVILVPFFAFSLPLHYRATATNGSPELHRTIASNWS
jgi:hypothetical protein